MFCQDGWLNRKPREEFVPRGQWHCMPSNIKGAAIASKASYCMLWCGMTKCYLYIGSRPLIQFLCDSLQSQGSVSNSSDSTKTILFWSTIYFSLRIQHLLYFSVNFSIYAFINFHWIKSITKLNWYITSSLLYEFLISNVLL